MNYRFIFSITICNTVILLALMAFVWVKFSHEKREIVYIDNIRLFNGFNMTKDLNKINGDKIKKQKKKLDSLYIIYDIFRDNDQTDKLEALETQLRNEDQVLNTMNKRFSNEISQTVWNRLNTYVNEYGMANDYKIVLGTQGNGNVMYAQKGKDITDEVMNYSNSRYEGER
ncbi:OmpH family outer membrane protein [Ulvibacterium marinum]|uniref:OmpH family outer membrane protein n=1 Tax=Ulvibacterium marinum TaxID=2419782 RepID=UPI0024947FC1|nr:OmpH family outer membrane protein [Ulvibacterium marinum]